jgi:ectoine hydroxylase-related dioxygenase (phytanoyl-CoA dioxygenase family)
VIAHPRVLEGAQHVLGPDLKLSSLNIRSADPGAGARPLHADMAALPDARGSWVCNTIWMLDACTPDNGALGLVPGSHRRGQLPQQALADPEADHSDLVLVTGRAGTGVVLSAHAWHAGIANRTGRPRRESEGAPVPAGGGGTELFCAAGTAEPGPGTPRGLPAAPSPPGEQGANV